jgi:glyoxylase-like metal-dependent hydrolase (beta-lactamase superfamily II)/rhodanese-related sulfurtransferase
MRVEQIYTDCLAQGAYYIESEGEGAIIDPLREVSTYTKKAAAAKVKIKYIFETHFHADFVSGHITLAQQTGAPIIYGPNANPAFEAYIARDGEEFKIGKLCIKVLHTPGHTIESTSYLLFDENRKEHAVFTGDTLFLGDVGRPDLAQKGEELSVQDLAGYAFESLRGKIMPLPDDVIVYPAHGAGSACGKNMMKETMDTLGNQKKINYALRADMNKAEFIEEVTEGLLPPPSYFPMNVKLNKEGYESIDIVVKNGSKPLTVEEFENIAHETQAVILDVRSIADFAIGHLPKSIFIGLDGGFAPWVGELIVDVKKRILLVVPEGRAEETVTRLSRVGFDNSLGFLSGGIEAWKEEGKEIDTVNSISATEFISLHNKTKREIFDVRKQSEYLSEHVLESSNIPLSDLNLHLSEFPNEAEFFLHCAGGYRSMIAASILKSRGYHNLIDIQGGYQALKQTEIPKSNYVCSSTL